jgi:hypothetical protein
MVVSMLKALCFFLIVVCNAHAADSFLFDSSSDRRLMSDINKLGELENGLAVYSWRWNETARNLDARYGAPGTTGGHISMGFIAQEVAKVYPEAITIGDHGFLLINGQQLAKEDQFIRWKLTSESRTVNGRCAKIQQSRYILCF